MNGQLEHLLELGKNLNNLELTELDFLSNLIRF